MRTLLVGSMLAVLCAAGCDSPPEKAGPTPARTTTTSAPSAADTSKAAEEAKKAAKEREEDAKDKAEDDKDRVATAEFKGADTTKLDGDAKLTVVPDGVKIVIDLEAFPAGVKGAHIHEKDDCSDLGNKSMGEHFNPDAHAHGLPGGDAGATHLGDMGNITITAEGEGHLEFVVKGANLKDGDKMSLLGRSIIIHEAEDKGTVESAGKPLACAPIKLDT